MSALVAGRWSWGRPFAAASLVVAGLVVAAATLGVLRLRHETTSLTSSRLRLAGVQAQVNHQDSLEWQAIARARVDEPMLQAFAAAQRETRATFGRFGVQDAPGALRAYGAYVVAVDEELRLLAAGRRVAAERVDEERVDPAFDRLEDQLGAESAGLARRARISDVRADGASWLILGLAGFTVVALLALVHRGRQRSLARLLREQGLEREVRLSQQLAREREHDANHDALTGMANRRFFRRRLREEIVRAGRQGAQLAVLLLDLDRFKEVNDTLGHQAGDELLQQLAPRLQSLLREYDVPARLGGDEFAILIPAGQGLDASIARELATRLGDAIQAPFDFHGLALEVGASIGIALFPDHGADEETLMRHADVAMYRAKGERSGHELYAPEIDHNSREQLTLSAELRQALETGQIIAHYQPKADLHSGRVDSVEALVRWQHPARGLLAPDAFLAVAEHAGLMPRLPAAYWSSRSRRPPPGASRALSSPSP